MKSLRIFFFLLCLSINNHGQIDTYFEIDKKIMNQVILQDSLKDIKKDSLSNLWLTKNWNTSTYNPYRKETQIIPFNIIFTDSIYNSPIERKKVITSRYGWRNRRAHKGIDIDIITGDNIMAMFDGKVRYVNSTKGHGKVVIIRHYNGLETLYAHLSKQSVKVNDIVKKGQVIGKGGETGNARGSHLHLEVSFKGIYIHPEYLFDFGEKNKIRSKNIWVTKNWITPYLHNSKRQSSISICATYEEAIQSNRKRKEVYVVRKGDTLSKISTKHHVSITSICKTNAIRKTSILKVGQKLVLVQ